MAIEYELNLSTTLTPTLALETISSQIDGLAMTWNGGSGHYLLGPTIEIDGNEPSKSKQEIIRDNFRFTPTLLIGFRFKLKDDSDYDTSRHTMLQATMMLMEHAQDAVLLFNYETIVLQRLGGQLVFNSAYDTWNDAWLRSRLTTPAEWRPLRSPLL